VQGLGYKPPTGAQLGLKIKVQDSSNVMGNCEESTNMRNRLPPARINVSHTTWMAKSPLLTMLDNAMECLLGITDALVPQSVECIVYSISEQCHAHHVAGVIK
jgi:hypothetical protein